MKVFLLENIPYEYGACPVSLIAANSAKEARKIYMNTSDRLCSDENYSVEEFEDYVIVRTTFDSAFICDSYVLSLGSNAEVLEPEDVRERIHSKIEGMLGLYK